MGYIVNKGNKSKLLGEKNEPNRVDLKEGHSKSHLCMRQSNMK